VILYRPHTDTSTTEYTRQPELKLWKTSGGTLQSNAEGVRIETPEGGGIGRGVPLPSRLGGLGERHERGKLIWCVLWPLEGAAEFLLLSISWFYIYNNFMARNSLSCADVPLRNCSFTCHTKAGTCCDQPAHQIWSLCVHPYEDMKANAKCRNWVVWRVMGHWRSPAMPPFDRTRMTYYSKLMETMLISCTVFNL